MATGARGARSSDRRVGERHVVVRFADDEIAEGSTDDLDLDRPDFQLRLDSLSDNSREAIVPLGSVKRVLLERERITSPIPDDVLRKVAVHFWDGEVVTGLLRDVPSRHRHGMRIELISPDGERAEVYALPYQAIKAVFFLRTWDTRPPQLERSEGTAHWTLPRQEAPLIDLLGEIRGLRGLRHRGQISDVEYERRRSQVLDKM